MNPLSGLPNHTRLILLFFIAFILVAIPLTSYIFSKNQSETNARLSPTPTPDPTANWKTYTVPEDNSISFKYPPDWKIDSDNHDTATNPYNRFVKIIAPTLYKNGGDFVLRFYYSPGNSLAKDCGIGVGKIISGGSGNIKSTPITINGRSLKILTSEEDNIPGFAAPETGMSIVDGSNCYITTPTGIIIFTAGLGSEAGYSISGTEWQATPESATFEEIFKSLRF